MELCRKVFTAWVNYHLAPKKVRISNLEADLSDGVVLITLSEVLLNKHIDIPKIHETSRAAKIDVVTRLFQYLSHFSVNISISPADVVDGASRPIYMVLLLLVTHFHVETQKKPGAKQESSKAYLLSWLKEQAAGTGLHVNDFASLKDGRLLCRLVHNAVPRSLDIAAVRVRLYKLHGEICLYMKFVL